MGPQLTRRTVLAGGASIASLALTSRLYAQSDRPALTVAVQEIPPQLDPVLIEYNSGYRIMFNVYDTLVGMNYLDDFALTPGLARSWQRLDDLTLEVQLREGVKFHNGEEMTSEDVAFTFGAERMMDPQSRGHAPTRAYLGTIEAVEPAGRYAVRVTTREPDPVLPQRLAGWTAQVLNKKAFESVGDWDRWAREPVATGPFRMGEFRTGERLVLEAFDDYWGGRPTVQSVTFVVIPELSARIAGLISGEFDIITELPPDQFSTVESRGDLEVIGGPIANNRVVKYDTSHPVLQKVEIRQALSLAIDRQALVDSFWGGRVSVPRGNQVPAFGDMYIEDYPLPEYNPAKARELIAAAGYQGEPIEYRTVDGYYIAQLPTAQVLTAMWEAVGLKIDLGVRENFGQINTEGFAIRDGSEPVTFPDPLSSLWRAYGPASRGTQSAVAWENERFDTLGQILLSSLDQGERRRAFREMLDIVTWQDPPATVLHSFGMFYGKRKAVQWQPYPAAYMDFRPHNLAVL